MVWRSGLLASSAIGIAAGWAGAACSGLPPAPSPAQLDAGAAASAASLPLGPPLLRPGEQMQWRLRVGPFTSGSMHISAAAPSWMNGRRVAVVRGRFATRGLASLFDDRVSDDTTWIDLGTARPLHYRSEMTGDGEPSTLEARFDDGAVELVERKPDGERRRARQKVLGADRALNLYAALFALRAWPDGSRGRAALSVWTRSRLWRAEVVRGQAEILATALGRVCAVRIDGIAWRTRRDGSADRQSRARRFRIYLSADRARLPVLLETETRFGWLRAELVQYRASGRPTLEPQVCPLVDADFRASEIAIAPS